MKNNKISIDDYNFRFNSKGICHVKFRGKFVGIFNVFRESEKINHSSSWNVKGCSSISAGKLELFRLFIQNAIDDYETFGHFN